MRILYYILFFKYLFIWYHWMRIGILRIKKSSYAGHEYWIRYRTDLQRHCCTTRRPLHRFQLRTDVSFFLYLFFFLQLRNNNNNNKRRTETPHESSPLGFACLHDWREKPWYFYTGSVHYDDDPCCWNVFFSVNYNSLYPFEFIIFLENSNVQNINAALCRVYVYNTTTSISILDFFILLWRMGYNNMNILFII